MCNDGKMSKNRSKMNNITKKLQIKRIILILIIALWMCVIFCLSGQNGDESSSTSSKIVNVVVDIFTKITDKELTVKNVDILTYIIRKMAHFTLYFILAIPTFLLFETYNIATLKRYIYTILFCFVYASTDEIHQIFSQGRNGNVIDILIDTLGSIFGTIFIQVVSNIICKSSIRRNK